MFPPTLAFIKLPETVLLLIILFCINVIRAYSSKK